MGEQVPDVPSPASASSRAGSRRESPAERGTSEDGTSENGTSENGAAQAGSSAAARQSPERRQLSFRASGLTIELEIADSGGYQRLTGQLIPRQPAVVQIRAAGGVITVEADPLGRFSADTVPLGPVSLRCRLGGDVDRSPVVTGWITLGM
jgi:hypothetical protein